MSRTPAFSEALRRAKKAYNAQAIREGRTSLGEHDLEEAVWAVYELFVARREPSVLRGSLAADAQVFEQSARTVR